MLHVNMAAFNYFSGALCGLCHREKADKSVIKCDIFWVYKRNDLRHSKAMAKRQTKPKTLTPLKQWRLKRGLSLVSLAAEVGVDATYLSRLERSERRLNSELIQKIAVVLECPPGALLGSEPASPNLDSAPERAIFSRILSIMLAAPAAKNASADKLQKIVEQAWAEYQKMATLSAQPSELKALLDYFASQHGAPSTKAKSKRR